MVRSVADRLELPPSGLTLDEPKVKWIDRVFWHLPARCLVAQPNAHCIILWQAVLKAHLADVQELGQLRV
jgi:hypothetical protein